MTTTRAVVYCRASSDPHLTLASVTDQQTDCQRYCDRMGFEVVKVLLDADRSASQWANKVREGFQELLQMVAAKSFDVLVVWEASRVSRNMPDFITLKTALVKANITMHNQSGSVVDFAHGDQVLVATIEAAVAEREAASIRDRAVRTSRLRAEEGKPNGSIPFGYKRERDAITGRMVRQVIDPETAQYVREWVDRLFAGDTIFAMAQDMTKRGVPRPKPARTSPEKRAIWQRQTITQILKSPAIAGLRQHHGEVLREGTWKAIITEDERAKVLAILDDKTRKTHRGTAPAHLLSWIIRCGNCGTPMVFTHSHKGTLQNYRCDNSNCHRQVAGQTKHVDAAVEAVVRAWLAQPLNLAQLSAEAEKEDADVEGITAQIDTLRKRADEAADAYAAGDITAQTLSRIEKQLLPQIDELQDQLRPKVDDPTVSALLSASDPVLAWDNADLMTKRTVLRNLFDIRLDRAPTKGGRWNPDRVRMTRI